MDNAYVNTTVYRTVSKFVIIPTVSATLRTAPQENLRCDRWNLRGTQAKKFAIGRLSSCLLDFVYAKAEYESKDGGDKREDATDEKNCSLMFGNANNLLSCKGDDDFWACLS